MAAAADAAAALSRFAAAHPEVAEVEVNPLLVLPAGPWPWTRAASWSGRAARRRRRRSDDDEGRTPASVRGKRVVVTAAAAGIGATVAARFAEAGAACVHLRPGAEALAAYLAAHPGIGGTAADVAEPDDVAASSPRPGALGGLDVLVNNAGVAGPAAPVEEMDLGRAGGGRWT